MGYTGQVIDGRKSAIRGDRVITRIARSLMPLVHLYAEEKGLYVEEAVSRLVAKGLAAEKGLVITGDEVGIYGPLPSVTEEGQRQVTD
jgi:hypothetical protein